VRPLSHIVCAITLYNYKHVTSCTWLTLVMILSTLSDFGLTVRTALLTR
jgi:hypothetical protein